MEKDEMREAFEERGYNIADCTCSECDIRRDCIYAFDLYNTNGDCLAAK